MVCIVDRLSKTLNRKINSDQIWKHLKTMYNLKALDDLEPLPFPNEESNFNLPADLQTKLRSESEDGDGSSKGGSTSSTPKPVAIKSTQSKESERKLQKSESNDAKYPKRTRGSLSIESGSPASTPPPQSKRRRI